MSTPLQRFVQQLKLQRQHLRQEGYEAVLVSIFNKGDCLIWRRKK